MVQKSLQPKRQQRRRHFSSCSYTKHSRQLAMDSAQLYLVTSCEELKQAWNALKNHFERETSEKAVFSLRDERGPIG